MATHFKGIKKAEEYQRGELARDVLRVIAAGVVIGSAAVVAPNTLQVIDYFNPNGVTERRRIWRAIKYLEERNRVTIQKRGDLKVLLVTQQGKIALDEDSIWDLQIERPWRWDHKWRLIMFDLPVNYSRQRMPFRAKLVDFGFRVYQKSVFIYPYECRKEVFAVAEMYGVREYVRYIVAEEIADMHKFAKEFDLL